jgi:hypothetical protein
MAATTLPPIPQVVEAEGCNHATLNAVLSFTFPVHLGSLENEKSARFSMGALARFFLVISQPVLCQVGIT